MHFLKMHKDKAFASLLGLLLGCLLPVLSPAHMVGVSTEELARGSDLVVEGTVEGTTSQWSNDGTTIYTSATVVIQRVIRGKTEQNRVVVEYEGGKVGRDGLKVSDVAEMAKGEKVLLFLTRGRSRKDGFAFHTVGKAQGKYTVGDDGIARKKGVSLGRGREVIDAEIPVDVLIEKIQSVQ